MRAARKARLVELSLDFICSGFLFCVFIPSLNRGRPFTTLNRFLALAIRYSSQQLSQPRIRQVVVISLVPCNFNYYFTLVKGRSLLGACGIVFTECAGCEVAPLLLLQSCCYTIILYHTHIITLYLQYIIRIIILS